MNTVAWKVDEPVNPVAERGMTKISRGFWQECAPMLAMAIPVVLGELAWMGMNIVDLMMVGRLGVEAIGAVSLGATLHWGVLIFGFGLLFGLDTKVSQSFGANRMEDCRKYLIQGVYLALAITPIIMVVVAFSPLLLTWLKIDPAVVDLAVPYLVALNWSTLPLLLFSVFRRYLQALSIVKSVTMIMIAANVLNAILNYWLIHGGWGVKAMGVEGSGWATFGSRVFLCVGVLGIVWLTRRKYDATATFSLGFDRIKQIELLRLGLPAACHITLEVLVFLLVGLLAGVLGKEPLAAHQLVINLASISFMLPMGISTAGAVRVGQALGRNDPEAAKRAGWTALALGISAMACCGLTFSLFPRFLLGLYTNESHLITIGIPLLLLAALFQLFDGMQVVASGILRGAGDTKSPMICTLVAYWLIGLPIGSYLCFYAKLGIAGLWVGLTIGLMGVGVVLLYCWLRMTRKMHLVAKNVVHS